MERVFKLILVFIFIATEANSQKVIEIAIKPTEFIYRNFETAIGLGNAKNHFGILFSFRPSTRDSGEVKAGGSGAAGGYNYRYLNRLYSSYTLGLYHKLYIKTLNDFIETNIFYRNWSFEKKQAEFKNVEGYRFNGLRTENVDVYCLKFLYGHTYKFNKKNKSCSPYLDVYAGISLRYQEETFETFNGYVYDVFFMYNKDEFYYTRPAPQLGIKMGLTILYKGK